MTAFLFIPATIGSGATRRIDFASIAGLFAETEEPQPAPGTSRTFFRAAAVVLLLLFAIGDTLLVARPGPGMGLPTIRAASARPTL